MNTGIQLHSIVCRHTNTYSNFDFDLATKNNVSRVFDDKCDEQLDCNRLIFSSMTESSNFLPIYAVFLVTIIQSLPQFGPYWPNIEIAVMGFPNDARDTDLIAINLKPLLSEAVWS